MIDRDEERAVELVDISYREMEEVQGGAWYAKFDGVDGGESAARLGGWGAASYQYSYDTTY